VNAVGFGLFAEYGLRIVRIDVEAIHHERTGRGKASLACTQSGETGEREPSAARRRSVGKKAAALIRRPRICRDVSGRITHCCGENRSKRELEAYTTGPNGCVKVHPSRSATFLTAPQHRSQLEKVMNRRFVTGLATATALAGSLLITGVNSASAAPDSSAAAAADARGGGGGVTSNDRLDASIKVTDPTLKIVATMRGTGKQVYDCNASEAWALREPVATLAAQRGGQGGIHGAGPFWASFDGSRVVSISPVPAENQFKSPAGLTNINWLKVTAKENFGQGVFGKVKTIQRIDTRGGAAPTTACTTGNTIAVDYSTNYVFWAPK